MLNPASGRDADGRLWLLPRLVERGNVSRVGLAEIVVEDGRPVGVRREGVVLAPDAGWERAHRPWRRRRPAHDLDSIARRARDDLRRVRPVRARSRRSRPRTDLRTWTRHGPIHFDYQADLDTDLNLFPNKDCVFFPEPVTAPDGRPAYAMLHRPMWDLSWVRPGRGDVPAARASATTVPASGSATSRSSRSTARRPRSPTSSSTAAWRCRSTTSRRSRSAPARRRCAPSTAGWSSTTA